MTSYMVPRRNIKSSSRNIKGIKQDGSTNGGSDPRICGVVAPDLRGVNLVPTAQCSGPPPPSSPAPAFGTVQHNTVNTNFQPPATPTPTQRTEGLPPHGLCGVETITQTVAFNACSFQYKTNDRHSCAIFTNEDSHKQRTFDNTPRCSASSHCIACTITSEQQTAVAADH